MMLFATQYVEHDIQTRQVNHFHLPFCHTEMKNTLSYAESFVQKIQKAFIFSIIN